MSFLKQLLKNISHSITSSFPDVSQGLESVNYCTFASCFQGFDITASCFSENWLQQMESSEDLRICEQKH